jgi:hypothetical protein
MVRYSDDAGSRRMKFRTKHWESLWRSNIDGLVGLKKASQSGTAFVAIDMEGYHKKGEPVSATEIGIAVSWPHEQTRDSSLIPTLLGFFSQHRGHMESYSFRIEGRERRERDREKYHFGQAQVITPDDLDSVIATFLKSLKDRFQSLTLVGFDLSLEFSMMASKLQPNWLSNFSSWVDLQEVVADLSGTNLKQPGMTDTLLALGFTQDGHSVRSHSGLHNPGNDSVRMLAILDRLLGLDEDATLQIHQAIRRSSQEEASAPKPSRKYWRRRPPREIYPFTARIRIPGANITSIIKNIDWLERIFAAFAPVAVGIVNGGQYGWICLSSAEGLAQFIEDVNGQEVGGIMWSATTDFDATEGAKVVALTPVQLREVRRAEQVGQRENKRMQRRCKQIESEADIADLGLGMITGENP